MDAMDKLLVGSADDWIGALPEYQQRIVRTLLGQGKTPEEAAKAWLSASGSAQTAGLGGGGVSPFFDKLLEEFDAFICRDDRYVEDKKKLTAQLHLGHLYAVGIISAAIAPAVGAAAPFIAPAIALMLITVTHMGKNAWCAMRTEQKSGKEA